MTKESRNEKFQLQSNFPFFIPQAGVSKTVTKKNLYGPMMFWQILNWNHWFNNNEDVLQEVDSLRKSVSISEFSPTLHVMIPCIWTTVLSKVIEKYTNIISTNFLQEFHCLCFYLRICRNKNGWHLRVSKYHLV